MNRATAPVLKICSEAVHLQGCAECGAAVRARPHYGVADRFWSDDGTRETARRFDARDSSRRILEDGLEEMLRQVSHDHPLTMVRCVWC